MPSLGWRKRPATDDTTTPAPERKPTTDPKPPSKKKEKKKHKLQTKKSALLPPPPHRPHFSGAAKPLINTITVIVGTGPEQQNFTVSADLMRERSQYFRPIIERLRAAGMTAPILLTAVRPALFGGYVEWCRQTVEGGGWYVKPVTRGVVDAEMGEADGEGGGAALPSRRIGVVVKTLVSFWLLGEFLQDTAFQNAVMGQLLKQSRQLAMEYVEVALEISGLVGPVPLPTVSGEERGGERSVWTGNALQRWVIDLLAPVVTKRHVEEMQCAWSTEFLVALFSRTLEMPAGGRLEMVPGLEGGRGEGFMVRKEA